jgi:hypothetical protein
MVVCFVVLESLIRGFGLFFAEREIISIALRSQAGRASGPANLSSGVIHPFYGWTRRPNSISDFSPTDLALIFPNQSPSLWFLENNRVNLFGFRSSIYDYRELESSDFVIALAGGSVAEDIALIGGDALVAALTDREPHLRDRIRIISLAMGGFKQPQQLAAFAQAVMLGIPIDAVVNVDGFNEMALGGWNAIAGDHPLLPFMPFYLPIIGFSRGTLSRDAIMQAAAAVSYNRKAEKWTQRFTAIPLFQHSQLLRGIAGSIVLAMQRRGKEAEQRMQALSTTGPDRKLNSKDVFTLPDPCLQVRDACAELIAEMWQRMSSAMHGIAREASVVYVHVLQPNQYVENSKVFTEAEKKKAFAHGPGFAEAWGRAAAAGYPALKKRGQRLRALGVPFHDLTHIFRNRSDTIYRDECCHVNWVGNQILGRVVGEILADEILRQGGSQRFEAQPGNSIADRITERGQ